MARESSNVNRNQMTLKQELKNPCLKEQELSLKCLSKNNYDKEACEVVFTNYNNCRQFWDKVKAERKKAGIGPELPLPEDRSKVKDFYLREWGFKSGDGPR